ncbi:hypothetical protein BUALT_Bualt09G0098100 [Buddleja alternifolia]|uniref:Uncharacterized protein n=1 Tax=Buddleja alternifolia TaxID=168488 RepID=A0AAV6X7Z7_9LAMI|nr:hypothetical protein BUALT_Bualt09G0098100 [Buddleja alternifolia]
MLSCMKSYSQGYSADNTPTSSSSQLSPTINLSQEYALAVQSNSFGEIRRTFDKDQNVDVERVNVFEEPQLLEVEQVLRPSRECVQEALSPIRPNSLTYTFFEHTERTFRLCFLIYQRVRHARVLYTPIHNLLDDLSLDFDSKGYFLSHSQCKLAFNVFLQFDSLENPFLLPDSHNFNDIRRCFSQLRLQLDPLLRKSRSTGSALRSIAASVGVAISAVTTALATIVAGPICPTILPLDMTKKGMVHLNTAAIGVYVLEKELDTIGSLVARLHGEVEDDKHTIRPGLERGMDRYMIQEILKQLRRNRLSFVQQLVVLEDHLFLYFAAINRSRSQLLQEILLHQNPV